MVRIFFSLIFIKFVSFFFLLVGGLIQGNMKLCCYRLITWSVSISDHQRKEALHAYWWINTCSSWFIYTNYCFVVGICVFSFRMYLFTKVVHCRNSRNSIDINLCTKGQRNNGIHSPKARQHSDLIYTYIHFVDCVSWFCDCNWNWIHKRIYYHNHDYSIHTVTWYYCTYCIILHSTTMDLPQDG